ncbi:Metalloenzyme, LuxS/M16 peptidase-like protein [Pseudocohnilembus persalinus]|uniref:Metalloenzyme, LuxS/M16 peptidase-like protein n=1 Tax=Pseudocohnilembus persalinus TaxID=266149 RepID=A0A0V0Q7S3_PSEPJ|nr:Metalloenzyme, LuxS/M16 peptidase-like protein [Pseudocohnilembus persalinus]|eukprot:KRW98246.1 Metalloenzyme, LuxS/M16 peptidase-like protein [Pseudocohnilembus persalinus]
MNPSTQNIIKSQNDKRQYKAIILENKIEVLMIHDPETDKSSASLDVFVGQLEDPEEYQGIAHFLEHMLFMGTQKYPVQNEYSAFITQNSGSENAFTDLTDTNYYFDIANEAFEKGLDMFAQFFIAPLFDETCVEKEIKAVDSEHQMGLAEDSSRGWQLFKETAHKSSFKQNGGGNLKTLDKPDIREALLKFYDKYYSSNLMKLVLYSNQSIEQLEQYAISKFTEIPNKNLTRPRYNQIPFDSKNLQKIVKLVPIRDEDTLELIWILPTLRDQYKEKTNHLLSYILGHEGKNSLTTFLIDEGLITELESYYEDILDFFTIIGVRLTLTQEGFEKYEQVCAFIFKYLNTIKKEQIDEWIYQERKKIEEIAFKFKEKEAVADYVTELSQRMQYCPTEEILIYDFIYSPKFNKKMIQDALEKLVPENMQIYLSSHDFEEDEDYSNYLTEEHYGTRYVIEDFPEDLAKAIKNADQAEPEHTDKGLGMSVPNEFIPENFELLPEQPEKIPRKIHQNQLSETWYMKDFKFNVSKGWISIFLYTNDLNLHSDIKGYVQHELWLMLFESYIQEIVDMADQTYLKCNIHLRTGGLQLKFKGYSDTLFRFTLRILQAMSNYDVEKHSGQRVFDNIYEKCEMEYQNYFKDHPEKLAYDFSQEIRQVDGKYLHFEKLNVLQNITYKSFVKSIKNNWLKEFYLETFYFGNFNQQQVIQCTEKICQIFSNIKPLKKENILPYRQVILEQNKILKFEYSLDQELGNEEEPNSCLFTYYQGRSETPEVLMLTKILKNFIQEPFFDQLRTNEQLGYYVEAQDEYMRGITGIQFVVQSSVADPNKIATRIDAFLEERKEKIEALTQEEFDIYRQSALVKMTQKEDNMYEEARYYYQEVKFHTYKFDRKEHIIENISKFTLQDLKDYFYEIFFEKNQRSEVHIVSKAHKEDYVKSLQLRKDKDNIIEIDDILEFHKKMRKQEDKLHQDYYNANQNQHLKMESYPYHIKSKDEINSTENQKEGNKSMFSQDQSNSIDLSQISRQFIQNSNDQINETSFENSQICDLKLQHSQSNFVKINQQNTPINKKQLKRIKSINPGKMYENSPLKQKYQYLLQKSINSNSSFYQQQELYNLEKLDVEQIKQMHVRQQIKILKKNPQFRNETDLEVLKSTVNDIQFFQNLAKEHGQEKMMQVIKKLKYENFKKGHFVFHKEDIGSKFYIILRGSVAVLKPEEVSKFAKYIDKNENENHNDNYNNHNHKQNIDKDKNMYSENQIQRNSDLNKIYLLPDQNYNNLSNNNDDNILAIKKNLVKKKIQDYVFKLQQIQENFKTYTLSLQKEVQDTDFCFCTKQNMDIDIQQQQQTATVLTLENCEFAVLEKKDYLQFLEQLKTNDQKRKQKFLIECEHFKNKEYKDIIILSHVLKNKIYSKNQYIYKQGDLCQGHKGLIYLIYKGEIQLTCNPYEQQKQEQKRKEKLQKKTLKQLDEKNLQTFYDNNLITQLCQSQNEDTILQNNKNGQNFEKQYDSKTYRENPNKNQLNQSVKLTVLGPGQFFGVDPLIKSKRRINSAYSLQNETEIFKFTLADINELLFESRQQKNQYIQMLRHQFLLQQSRLQNYFQAFDIFKHISQNFSIHDPESEIDSKQKEEILKIKLPQSPKNEENQAQNSERNDKKNEDQQNSDKSKEQKEKFDQNEFIQAIIQKKSQKMTLSDNKNNKSVTHHQFSSQQKNQKNIDDQQKKQDKYYQKSQQMSKLIQTCMSNKLLGQQNKKQGKNILEKNKGIQIPDFKGLNSNQKMEISLAQNSNFLTPRIKDNISDYSSIQNNFQKLKLHNFSQQNSAQNTPQNYGTQTPSVFKYSYNYAQFPNNRSYGVFTQQILASQRRFKKYNSTLIQQNQQILEIDEKSKNEVDNDFQSTDNKSKVSKLSQINYYKNIEKNKSELSSNNNININTKKQAQSQEQQKCSNFFYTQLEMEEISTNKSKKLQKKIQNQIEKKQKLLQQKSQQQLQYLQNSHSSQQVVFPNKQFHSQRFIGRYSQSQDNTPKQPQNFQIFYKISQFQDIQLQKEDSFVSVLDNLKSQNKKQTQICQQQIQSNKVNKKSDNPVENNEIQVQNIQQEDIQHQNLNSSKQQINNQNKINAREFQDLNLNFDQSPISMQKNESYKFQQKKKILNQENDKNIAQILQNQLKFAQIQPNISQFDTSRYKSKFRTPVQENISKNDILQNSQQQNNHNRKSLNLSIQPFSNLSRTTSFNNLINNNNNYDFSNTNSNKQETAVYKKFMQNILTQKQKQKQNQKLMYSQTKSSLQKYRYVQKNEKNSEQTLDFLSYRETDKQKDKILEEKKQTLENQANFFNFQTKNTSIKQNTLQMEQTQQFLKKNDQNLVNQQEKQVQQPSSAPNRNNQQLRRYSFKDLQFQEIKNKKNFKLNPNFIEKKLKENINYIQTNKAQLHFLQIDMEKQNQKKINLNQKDAKIYKELYSHLTNFGKSDKIDYTDLYDNCPASGIVRFLQNEKYQKQQENVTKVKSAQISPIRKIPNSSQISSFQDKLEEKFQAIYDKSNINNLKQKNYQELQLQKSQSCLQTDIKNKVFKQNSLHNKQSKQQVLNNSQIIENNMQNQQDNIEDYQKYYKLIQRNILETVFQKQQQEQIKKQSEKQKLSDKQISNSKTFQMIQNQNKNLQNKKTNSFHNFSPIKQTSFNKKQLKRSDSPSELQLDLSYFSKVKYQLPYSTTSQISINKLNQKLYEEKVKLKNKEKHEKFQQFKRIQQQTSAYQKMKNYDNFITKKVEKELELEKFETNRNN